jgi:hypothetical protein
LSILRIASSAISAIALPSPSPASSIAIASERIRRPSAERWRGDLRRVSGAPGPARSTATLHGELPSPSSVSPSWSGSLSWSGSSSQLPSLSLLRSQDHNLDRPHTTYTWSVRLFLERHPLTFQAIGLPGLIDRCDQRAGRCAAAQRRPYSARKAGPCAGAARSRTPRHAATARGRTRPHFSGPRPPYL